MRFYKLTESGYITGIGTGGGGEEITAAEYADIMTAIQGKPTETDTVGYRLKTDLTWEQYEKEPEPEDDTAYPEDIAEALEGIA
jgi:hypothetical protein